MTYTTLFHSQRSSESRLLHFQFLERVKNAITGGNEQNEQRRDFDTKKRALDVRLAKVLERIDSMITHLPAQRKAWQEWRAKVTDHYSHWSFKQNVGADQKLQTLENCLSRYERQLTDRERQLQKQRTDETQEMANLRPTENGRVSFPQLVKSMIAYPRAGTDHPFNLYISESSDNKRTTDKVPEYLKLNDSDSELLDLLVKAKKAGITFDIRQDPSAGYRLRIAGPMIPRGSVPEIHINPNDSRMQWKRALEKELDAYTWQPNKSTSSPSQ